MAIDVVDLPSAAAGLGDLSPREREILALVDEGMTSRDIARQLAVRESAVYHAIADLLDAVEFERPTVSAADIHRRAGTRPATAEEVARFHSELGPFGTDREG